MAVRPVFADTSFFFALAAKRDHWHAMAKETYSSLVKSARQILTTDYVI